MYCLHIGHSDNCLPQFMHVAMWPHSSITHSTGASIQILQRSSNPRLSKSAMKETNNNQNWMWNDEDSNPVSGTWIYAVSHLLWTLRADATVSMLCPRVHSARRNPWSSLDECSTSLSTAWRSELRDQPRLIYLIIWSLLNAESWNTIISPKNSP